MTVVVARPLGRMVDRFGADRTTMVGLFALAVFLPILGAGAGAGTYLVAFVVVVLMLAINFCYISVGTLLTRGGQEAGWSLSFATALSATIWNLGETAGALFGGVGLDTVGSMWRQASARRWSPRGTSSWS